MVSDGELEGLHLPYNDAIVVTTRIDNHNVHRIFVDNGGSVNVLFVESFDQLDTKTNQLKHVSTLLYRFAGAPVMLFRCINLPLIVGISLCQITPMVNFLAVQCPSRYSAIIRNPPQNT